MGFSDRHVRKSYLSENRKGLKKTGGFSTVTQKITDMRHWVRQMR